MSSKSSKARRECKRLKRSALQRVRASHRRIQDSTEIAYYYLSEMTQAKQNLTHSGMCRILNEYGPYLRYNSVVSSGGLYLVEVCRARHCSERQVLQCVEELVERRGALVDLQTNESPQSRENALCVASARGLSIVVEYLLKKGASTSIQSSGRFGLHTNPRRSIKCINQTPLEFSLAMKEAEMKEGASESSLKGLTRCIALLEGCNGTLRNG
jgi:hypothetical protein